MLWDTAGQEEFDAITRAYYRGSHCCVLAFSCTDRTSLHSLAGWKEKVERECGPLPCVLVMNKKDLVDSSLVSRCSTYESTVRQSVWWPPVIGCGFV